MLGCDEDEDPNYHFMYQSPRNIDGTQSTTQLARRWDTDARGDEKAVPQREKYVDLYIVPSRTQSTVKLQCLICMSVLNDVMTGEDVFRFSNFMKHLRSKHREQLTITDQAQGGRVLSFSVLCPRFRQG